MVRLGASQMRGQAHHHRLGHDQPVRQIEVAPHPRGIDHHALGDGARLEQCTMGQHEGLRDGERLGLPRAGGALVVLRHGAQHQRHQRLHAARRRQDVFRGDRVALLRHGGGRAAPGDIGFGDLADLGLAEQDDVGGELGEAAADDAEEADGLRQRLAADMPGRRRRGQVQFRRQPLHHRDALVAERRQRARRAGKLHLFDARAELVEALQMADERRRPDRAFQAEAGRQRLLQMGAAGHHRVAVAVRLGGEGLKQAVEFQPDQGEPLAHLKHGRGVHDVLRGSAPMGPRPRLARGA